MTKCKSHIIKNITGTLFDWHQAVNWANNDLLFLDPSGQTILFKYNDFH